jgi:hypothetical protein
MNSICFSVFSENFLKQARIPVRTKRRAPSIPGSSSSSAEYVTSLVVSRVGIDVARSKQTLRFEWIRSSMVHYTR